MAKILVTGAAGFIGYHTAARLLERGDTVVGLDSMSDYYDVSLKEARLARLRPNDGFRFERADVARVLAGVAAGIEELRAPERCSQTPTSSYRAHARAREGGTHPLATVITVGPGRAAGAELVAVVMMCTPR